MKQKGEELIVMSKRMFFLILAGLSVIGILLGFSIGYITAPVKEVKIHKTEETEKTVLPSTVETALAKKQEIQTQQTVQREEQQKVQQPEKTSPEKAKEVDLSKQTKISQIQESETTQEKQDLAQKSEQKKFRKTISQVKQQRLPFYTIQVGAFTELSNAKNMAERIKNAGYTAFISKEENYKVRVGRYSKFSLAKRVSEELNSKGFENFILKIKEVQKGGKQ